MALTNWAIEEARFSREKALTLLQEAQSSAKKASGPDISFLLKRTLKKLNLLAEEQPTNEIDTKSAGGPPTP
jgi:hypothetical protein